MVRKTRRTSVMKSEPKSESCDGNNSSCNGKPPETNNVNTEKVIYELGADATITFSNGSDIKVSKTMLAFYSPVFAEMFYGLSRENNVTMDEYNCETFKAFLDCLFGFRNYTPEDALLFYPIAHKFKVQKSLQDCVAKLTPSSSSEMNENICLTLNLALKYECDELVDPVVAFLKNSVGILNLFEREDYFYLLEPVSVSKIIENIKMTSLLITMLYKWGVNYLKKNKSIQNVRSFFEEHNILEKISLYHFESLQSILDFHNISKKDFFSGSEILNYMNTALKNPKHFLLKSEWIKVKQGDVIEETIIFKQPLSTDYVSKIQLEVSNNKILYEYMEGKDKEEEQAVQYKIYYNFKKQFCQSHCHHNKDLCSSVGDDFYCKKGALKNRLSIRNSNLKIESSNISNIKSIKVICTFHINCRILKTSEILSLIADNDDDDKLYFICGVEILQIE